MQINYARLRVVSRQTPIRPAASRVTRPLQNGAMDRRPIGALQVSLAPAPAIHQSVTGFIDFEDAPPGHVQSNRRTPLVWADERS